MRTRRAMLLGLVLALWSALAWQGCARAALPAPQRVSFESLDAGKSGVPVKIDGLYYEPSGPRPPQGFPAVVVLHGCSGMYSTAKGRESELSLHNAMWTRTLLDEGYAVLYPDSFRARGVREVCTIRLGERSIFPGTRRLDALGALRWLGTHDGVDRERIALLGFSHGGSTTLATVNAHDRVVEAFRARADAPPFFRGAVAYYPGCGVSLRAGARWAPATPTRVHIGEKDDWTPAPPCAELGAAQKARGAPLDVTVYPDSYHVFDGPGQKLVVRKDVPNGINGVAAGVTMGGNPAAAAAALASVRVFLRERFAQPPGVAADGIIPLEPAGAVVSIRAVP